MKLKNIVGIAALVLSSLSYSYTAEAASIITHSSGQVSLGVDDLGQLNTGGVGVRFNPTNGDGTVAGCLCEGWGVADAFSGATGYANNALGINNLDLQSFVSDGVTATSIVTIDDVFKVTHLFTPSTESNDLYEVKVKIENIGVNAVDDLRYRRVMDWDINPTEFNEFVTIEAGNSTALLGSNFDGFASSNPLDNPINTITEGVDVGPIDHGALFDFSFGSLAAGASKEFSIFYGASATESQALAALGAVDAEVYSLGQPSTEFGPTLGQPNTFMFGFKGVGGDPVIDDPNPRTTPEPSVLLGLIGLGTASVLTKRKAK